MSKLWFLNKSWKGTVFVEREDVKNNGRLQRAESCNKLNVFLCMHENVK